MNKVIIACDFEDRERLTEFLRSMKDSDLTLKIGMELFYKEGASLVQELKSQGYSIFLDLKLHDIPNTVEKAMINIAKLNVDIVNVHAQGGIEMMRRAKAALMKHAPQTKLIAVTILTSINQDILTQELGIQTPINEMIKHYALNVKKAGLDGVVCSPLEAPLIHEACGHDFLTVTPGIRLPDDSQDDQQRITTPEKAKALKTDFIVVGRSITSAKDPQSTYQKIKAVFYE